MWRNVLSKKTTTTTTTSVIPNVKKIHVRWLNKEKLSKKKKKKKYDNGDNAKQTQFVTHWFRKIVRCKQTKSDWNALQYGTSIQNIEKSKQNKKDQIKKKFIALIKLLSVFFFFHFRAINCKVIYSERGIPVIQLSDKEIYEIR